MIGSALIGSGASVLGNIFGAISQKKTNEMNLRINQMNNEFNERMMEKQMAWNEEMWNKQNEYNTASNQRARLEQAGLNPYLMLNGGSAGTASSVNSAQSAQAANAPAMQAYKPDMSSFVSAINTYANNKALEELRGTQSGLNQKGIDWYDAEVGSKIYQNVMTGLNQSSQRHLNWMNWDILSSSADSIIKQNAIRVDLMNWEAAQRRAQAALTNLQVEYQQVLNKYIEPHQALELAEKFANWKLTGQLTKESVSREMVNFAEANNINFHTKRDKEIWENTGEALMKALNGEYNDTANYYNSKYVDKYGRDWKPYEMRLRGQGLSNLQLMLELLIVSGINNKSVINLLLVILVLLEVLVHLLLLKVVQVLILLIILMGLLID